MSPRDPGAPLRPLRKEVVLLCGFLLCLAVAVAAVVLPELSGVDPTAEPTRRVGAASNAPSTAVP